MRRFGTDVCRRYLRGNIGSAKQCRGHTNVVGDFEELVLHGASKIGVDQDHAHAAVGQMPRSGSQLLWICLRPAMDWSPAMYAAVVDRCKFQVGTQDPIGLGLRIQLVVQHDQLLIVAGVGVSQGRNGS